MYTIVMHNMSTGLLQYSFDKVPYTRNKGTVLKDFKPACVAAKNLANKRRCVFAVHNAANKPVKMFFPEHVQVKENERNASKQVALVFDIPS
jgi:hypothetical protein